MRNEYLIETRTVADEKGNLLYLHYYLTEEIRPSSALPLYRIGIQKLPVSEPRTVEIVWTPPVTDCRALARGLLEKLIRNAVTPFCLLEVLDDLLSAEYSQAS